MVNYDELEINNFITHILLKIISVFLLKIISIFLKWKLKLLLFIKFDFLE